MDIRLIIVATTCTLLAACAGDKAGTSSAVADAESTAPAVAADTGGTEIMFIDLGSFDKKMTQAMQNKVALITVTSAQPFELNNIPERLEKWLAAIEESGGEVNVVADENPDGVKTRGAFIAAAGALMKMFGAVRADHTFRFAKNYGSATLRYNPLTGTVNEVSFERRN